MDLEIHFINGSRWHCFAETSGTAEFLTNAIIARYLYYICAFIWLSRIKLLLLAFMKTYILLVVLFANLSAEAQLSFGVGLYGGGNNPKEIDYGFIDLNNTNQLDTSYYKAEVQRTSIGVMFNTYIPLNEFNDNWRGLLTLPFGAGYSNYYSEGNENLISWEFNAAALYEVEHLNSGMKIGLGLGYLNVTNFMPAESLGPSGVSANGSNVPFINATKNEELIKQLERKTIGPLARIESPHFETKSLEYSMWGAYRLALNKNGIYFFQIGINVHFTNS